jgi:uncharacterized protein (TIGR03086 family)
MSEVAERYARLSTDFASRVASVPDDRWPSPAPCEGWTARDVVRHVVDGHGFILKQVNLSLGDVPSVDDDPSAAFAAARTVVQADLDDPAIAGQGFEGFFGWSTLEQTIDRFVCFDLVVHSWDLARAAGLDERLDPDEVRRVREVAAGFGDNIRSPGVCGPELHAPEGADEQTRVLAFLGRKAW